MTWYTDFKCLKSQTRYILSNLNHDNKKASNTGWKLVLREHALLKWL